MFKIIIKLLSVLMLFSKIMAICTCQDKELLCKGSFQTNEVYCQTATIVKFLSPDGDICSLEFSGNLPKLQTIILYDKEFCKCICYDSSTITIIGCKQPSTCVLPVKPKSSNVELVLGRKSVTSQTYTTSLFDYGTENEDFPYFTTSTKSELTRFASPVMHKNLPTTTATKSATTVVSPIKFPIAITTTSVAKNAQRTFVTPVTRPNLSTRKYATKSAMTTTIATPVTIPITATTSAKKITTIFVAPVMHSSSTTTVTKSATTTITAPVPIPTIVTKSATTAFAANVARPASITTSSTTVADHVSIPTSTTATATFDTPATHPNSTTTTTATKNAQTKIYAHITLPNITTTNAKKSSQTTFSDLVVLPTTTTRKPKTKITQLTSPPPAKNPLAIMATATTAIAKSKVVAVHIVTTTTKVLKTIRSTPPSFVMLSRSITTTLATKSIPTLSRLSKNEPNNKFENIGATELVGHVWGVAVLVVICATTISIFTYFLGKKRTLAVINSISRLAAQSATSPGALETSSNVRQTFTFNRPTYEDRSPPSIISPTSTISPSIAVIDETTV